MNAKNIAKAITNNIGVGELLFDTRKVVIEKIEGRDDVVVVNEGKEEEDAKMVAADSSAKAAKAAKTATTVAPEEETPSIPTGDRKLTVKLLRKNRRVDVMPKEFERQR